MTPTHRSRPSSRILGLVLCTVTTGAAALQASPVDVSGQWRGTPWGVLVVRGDVATYPRGSWKFAATGRRSFSGFWRESDTYGGTLRFALASHGDRITGSYDVDENADHDAGYRAHFELMLETSLGDATVSNVVTDSARSEPGIETALARDPIDIEWSHITERLLGAYAKPEEAEVGELLSKAEEESSHASPAVRRRMLAMTAEARIHRGEALQARSLLQELGDELHGSVADDATLLTMARSYLRLGEPGQAAQVLGQAYDATRGRMGDEHINSLFCLAELASATAKIPRLPEAMAMLERAAEASQRTLGSDAMLTQDVLTRLAEVKAQPGHHDEAVALLEKVTASRERSLGDNHPDVLLTRTRLAESLEQTGRIERAEVLLRATFAASSKLLGVDHPIPDRCRSDLFRLLTKQGRSDEAASYARHE